jgi:PAS domain S-box-containing protein
VNLRAPRDWADERHIRALLQATGQVHFRMSADWSRLLWLSGGGVLEDQGDPAAGWLDRYVPLEEQPRILAAAAAAVREQCNFDLEHRVRMTDGGTGWVRSRAVPVVGHDGGVEEWFGAAEDVTARRDDAERLVEREERLTLALDVADLATWDWNLRSGQVSWNDVHFRLQGYDPGEVTPSYQAWAERVHPEDLPRVEEAIRQARDGRSPFEAEFRVQPEPGSVRWCRVKGRFFHEDDEPVRMIGVMQDITASREAEARQRLLLSELQHRVRNALATIRSILRRSARTGDDVESYATHLEGRLDSLARVQAAMARDPALGLDLETLLRDELQAAAASEAQAIIAGPPVRLDAGRAELLALAFHELATNAIKHGALASAGGRVDVGWTLEDGTPPRLRLLWRETPAGTLPEPGLRGFGMEVLENTIAYNLRARTQLRIGADGLRYEVDLPLGAA